ncbi:hypothetical protein ACFVXQ_34465, partial [Kitasatospora sp. NPDC058263]
MPVIVGDAADTPVAGTTRTRFSQVAGERAGANGPPGSAGRRSPVPGQAVVRTPSRAMARTR